MESTHAIAPTPGGAGGRLVFHGDETLEPPTAGVITECGLFESCRTRVIKGRSNHVGILSFTRSKTSQRSHLGQKVCVVVDGNLDHRRNRSMRGILGYKTLVQRPPDHQNSGLPGEEFSGGGESGELGESSTHPKLQSSSHNLGLETGAGEIKKQSAVAMAGTSRAHEEQLPMKEGVDDHRHHEVEGLLDKSKECAMEV
jgi:hypothetical protein